MVKEMYTCCIEELAEVQKEWSQVFEKRERILEFVVKIECSFCQSRWEYNMSEKIDFWERKVHPSHYNKDHPGHRSNRSNDEELEAEE